MSGPTKAWRNALRKDEGLFAECDNPACGKTGRFDFCGGCGLRFCSDCQQAATSCLDGRLDTQCPYASFRNRRDGPVAAFFPTLKQPATKETKDET